MDTSRPDTGVPPPPPPPPPGSNTSGLGRGALVPPEIRRWNWGAFLLTWIWGIANRVYIALFSLIPLVGWVMAFVLGAKGSEWAWQNKTWPTVQRFKLAQRRWTVAGLIVWGCLLSLGVAVALLAPEPGEEALTETVVSDDGMLSMQIPSSWIETDRLVEGASLQAEHEFEDLYVVVAMNPAVDFDPNLRLKGFARLAREGILDAQESGRITSRPANLTIDGRPSVQVELEGLADGVRIVYVHTSIEVPDGFVEVIAWTLPSLIDETRPLLQRISASVRYQP